ncbi:MAG: TetR/AcrR family transcriptional regulator [Coriobacteriales bacterium]|jgi:AcrR family transcriptional regulator
MDARFLEPSGLSLYSNLELKMAVVEALDQLMGERDIDHISVSAICERANVSRATFYRYFKDKFGIVQWFVHYLHSQGANQIGRTLGWFAGYYTGEAIVAQHRSFFRNAAKSHDYNSLDQYAPRMRESAFKHTLEDLYHVEYDEHLRFLVKATVQVEVHLFPSWHYDEFDCTLEDACNWMVSCVPSELYELLKTPYTELSEEEVRRRASQWKTVDLGAGAPKLKGAPGIPAR